MRLNKPVEKFKEFYGKNTEQMPKLVAEGRAPLSVAGLMRGRLEYRNSDDSELHSNWNNNYFDTGDGALYMPDGKLVIAYDATALREMTGQSKTINGALALEGLAQADVEGVIFTKDDLGKMVLGQGLTRNQVENHPMWQTLVREDTNLLRNYADMIFTDNNYETAMGIFLDSPFKVPKMRAWFVGRADGRSGASGDGLDDDNGRLVGVASETQK